MDKNKIPVDKVTKPIQLLAAWLTGLIIIDGSFLTAASTLSAPSWASGLLIVAAVLNVPVFLFAIFLLQTKFRPEMQEDSFYSKYLESKTGTIRQPVTNNQLSKLKEEIFEANTNTIELVANLQEEIRNISDLSLGVFLEPHQQITHENGASSAFGFYCGGNFN